MEEVDEMDNDFNVDGDIDLITGLVKIDFPDLSCPSHKPKICVTLNL